MQPTMRSPTPAGAPLILAPRLPTVSTATTLTQAGVLNGAPPPLVSPTADGTGLIYPYDPYALAAGTTSPIFEYPPGLEQSAVGTFVR